MQNAYKIIILLVCMNIVREGNAQTPRTAPIPYTPATTYNYVRSWDAVIPENNTNNITVGSIVTQSKMATQYMDGLGRPVETVMKNGSLVTDPLNPVSSANAKDMVSPTLYDDFGRDQFKYLPFQANNTGGNASLNDGLFKLNPFQEQAAFYNSASTTSPIYNQGETFFYGQTGFEPSPLNRPIKTLAPGNNWIGGNRGADMKYFTNTITDAVRIWNVTNVVNSFGTYNSPGTYIAGTLFKTIAVDENGKQVIEFKDREGKVVLKKVQLTATADNGSGSGYPGWLCTYYIYDDLNNLRCVVQPFGVTAISGSWALTDLTILAEQCFRYEYDLRNRMIIKKVPGAGLVYMVYDGRDRLVMTQDANLLALGKWMVTKYDVLNRPIETGLWVNATSVSTHWTSALTSTAYPSTSSGYEQLTVTHYDDYVSIPGGLTSAFDATWASYFNATGAPLYAQPLTAVSHTRGLATWSQVKILGTASTFLYSVMIYDSKGRAIQVKSTNITGGTDVVTTQYNWAGQPLVSVQKQDKAGAPTQTSVVVTKLTYDDLGRLVKTEKKLSNTLVNSGAMPASFSTIFEEQYDALGQLKIKKLGRQKDISGNYTSTPVETLNYDYNIRGWLLGENRDFVKDLNTTNYFGFDLGYDKNGSLGTYVPQYNGNISGTIWKSKGDNQKRKYDFTYDAVNRLSTANFKQYVSGSGTSAVFDISAGINYSVAGLTYDANGNILTMNQNGLTLNTSPVIDQLTYTYQVNTNKLSKVMDAITADNKLGDFYDGTSGSGTDYNYDLNGNLNLDNNKAISSITYNHLNLPSVITVTGKGTITYTYDAAGNKLKKVTAESPSAGNNNITTTTTTNYIAGAVYETKIDNNAQTVDYTDRLQFIGHEEGRIRFRSDNNTLQYDYMIKDHLGNVRMVLTEEQQVDIYPVATLETSNLALEQSYYSIISGQITDKSLVTGLPAYVNHNIIPTNPVNTTFDNANSTKVYKLNKNSQNIGLGITLKIMAGDKLDIYGKSYYFQNNTGGTAANTAVTTLNILTGFLGGPTGANTSVHGLITAPQLNGNPGTTGLINTLLSSQTTTNNATPQVPKAFINYILFDEQFKCVGSGFAPVGANSVLTDYGTNSALHNIPVTKNGFVYIYCSNESPVDVFFDNLQVMQTRGPILEETHYYPFGLTMQGISSKSAGGLENKHKLFGKELQNKEFADGSGLEWYNYGMREYDQQIGRFFRVDPITEKFYELTPYQYCSNNPISNVDLDGAEGLDFRIFNKLVQNTVQNPNGTSAKVLGAVVGVGGAVTGAVTGTVNAVRHPIQTLKGLGHMLSQSPMQNAVDYGVNVASQYVGSGSDAFTNYAVGAHMLTDIGMVLSPMKGAFAGAKSPWALAPSARGFAIEGMLGGNLPKAFPVIDKFVDGVATSIKSIDLTADTYSKGNNLLNTLNGYTNKLDNFTGATREGVTVGSGDITSKVLQVAIQPGKASLGQWEQISKAMQHAKDNGVQFNLQFIK